MTMKSRSMVLTAAVTCAITVVSASGCSRESFGNGDRHDGPVPSSWHVLPEDAQQVSSEQAFSKTDEKGPGENVEPEQLSKSFDQIVSSTQESLESVDLSEPTGNPADPNAFLSKPKDWTPWHAEAFMTDLAVSVQGILAPLVLKGTPALTLVWRKKTASALVEPEAAPDLVLEESTDRRSIERQLEPAIRALVSSQRVKDESALRRNLMSQADQLASMGAQLNENPGLTWWVSRLRLDLAVEASGKVFVAPVTYGVGAEAKLRFEWHRIRSSKPAKQGMLANAVQKPEAGPVRTFVAGLARDLQQATDSLKTPAGFRAYSFRIGLGISPKGQIGVIKDFKPFTGPVTGSATVLAQVYFSRDIPKPKVHLEEVEELPPSSQEIPLIELDTTPEHQQFAAAHGISYESIHWPWEKKKSESAGAVYQMDRSRFQKGLATAAKMATYFAGRAGNAKPGKWKIHEMRTGLDLSVSGDVKLVNLTGMATAEINFYSGNF